jgi:hypothetical protein
VKRELVEDLVLAAVGAILAFAGVGVGMGFMQYIHEGQRAAQECEVR